MTPIPDIKQSSALVRTLPIVLPLVTLLIGVFVTMPIYETRTALALEVSSLESVRAAQIAKQDSLKELEVLATTPEMQRQFLRYAQPFREDAVFESIFTLARNANLEIESIGVGPGSRLPSGFSQATISFNVAFDTVAKLKKFIRDVSAQTDAIRGVPQRAYMINTLSYPYGSTDGAEISFPVDLSFFYLDV